MNKIPVILLAVLLLSNSVIHADYKLGLQYFKQGKYIEAASEFQADVDHAPHYDYGFYMLGACYMMLGKYDLAMADFKKAVELAPDKFDYHLGMAQLYMRQLKFYYAEETLNAASDLAITPAEKYQLSYYRGFARAGQRKHADAVIDLKNARLIKIDQTVLEQLGKSCYQVGDYACAEEAFKEALILAPNSYDANFYLSKALIEKARANDDKLKKKFLYGLAIQYAEKAVRMRPDDFENLNLLASAHFGAGNYDVAVQNFKAVIRLKPNQCWAMVNFAKVLCFQKKLQDAEEWLDKAIQCDPQSSIAYEILGSILLKEEKFEAALEAYKKADSIRPSPTIAESIERVKAEIEKKEEHRRKRQEDGM